MGCFALPQDDLPLDKAGDLVIEISSGIEQYCQCDFPSDYIADTKFLCNEKQPDVVVFQGRIIRTDERDSGSLVVGLENWASDKPTVIVQGERVQIDSSTEPANSNSNQDASDPWTAIGVAITVAILLLSGSLVTIIGCTIYCKKRQKRHSYNNYYQVCKFIICTLNFIPVVGRRMKATIQTTLS